MVNGKRQKKTAAPKKAAKQAAAPKASRLEQGSIRLLGVNMAGSYLVTIPRDAVAAMKLTKGCALHCTWTSEGVTFRKLFIAAI